MGFLALAGSDAAVVALTLRSACADLKVGATFLAGLNAGPTAARRALINASLAPAALRVWINSSVGAKSILRCSMSFAPDSSPNPSRTILLTCSRVKGFAGVAVVEPTLRSACRSGGFTPPLVHPLTDKLAVTSAGANLKVGATNLGCAEAGRVTTRGIANMKKVSVLGNLITASRGCLESRFYPKRGDFPALRGGQAPSGKAKGKDEG